MRKRKIREHRRRWEMIKRWGKNNLVLDLDYLNEYKYAYVKFRIPPWGNINLTNSTVPPLNGNTRKLILSGLLDIYDNWQMQLEKTGKPYYLKLWLYEHRISKSQVICAIGDSINNYSDSFYTPGQIKNFRPEQFGNLKDRLSQYAWSYHWDEDILDNNSVGNPDEYKSLFEFENMRNWFAVRMKRPHRTEKLKEKIGNITELYFFKKGNLWIGEKK